MAKHLVEYGSHHRAVVGKLSPTHQLNGTQADQNQASQHFASFLGKVGERKTTFDPWRTIGTCVTVSTTSCTGICRMFSWRPSWRSSRRAHSICHSDGEGRNGVWHKEDGVSEALTPQKWGVRKSVEWAAREGVSIQVEVADAMQVDPKETFDVVALVFAHMPTSMREAFHRRAWSWVKPGGILVVEGFHMDQLDYLWRPQRCGHAV